MKSAVCWLRRDIRWADNRALAEATSKAARVAVLFVYDTVILDKLQDKDDKRVTFIRRSVEELRNLLESRGSFLIAAHGDPVELVPQIARELDATSVFASHDDDPYALHRDQAVAAALESEGRSLVTLKDHVVFERREVVAQSGEPFRVYTPYMRAWRACLDKSDLSVHEPDPNRLWPVKERPSLSRAFFASGPHLKDIGFKEGEPWTVAGEQAGLTAFKAFVEKRLKNYATVRDQFDSDGTSGLSVHLRFGTVSIRECVRRAMVIDGSASEKWLNELVWRDFYNSILANFPHVATQPFRSEFENVKWPGNPEHFIPWSEGKTGYPLVDAAMRCLNATGWMHNRLRMVVASFFCKDLLLDYRLGEAWFARFLLDFDLASNNGGWQWCASTGTDSQPWFRIFNPVTQGIKFNPTGSFIRKWCPELAGFDDTLVHWPHGASEFDQLSAGCNLGTDYPDPIVQHSRQRELALNFFERLKK